MSRGEKGCFKKWELIEEVKTPLVCANIMLLQHDFLSEAHCSAQSRSSPFSGKIYPSASPFLEILGFPWGCRSIYSHQRAGQLCGQILRTQYPVPPPPLSSAAPQPRQVSSQGWT